MIVAVIFNGDKVWSLLDKVDSLSSHASSSSETEFALDTPNSNAS